MDKLGTIFNNTAIGTVFGLNAGLQLGMGNTGIAAIWGVAATLNYAGAVLKKLSNIPKP